MSDNSVIISAIYNLKEALINHFGQDDPIVNEIVRKHGLNQYIPSYTRTNLMESIMARVLYKQITHKTLVLILRDCGLTNLQIIEFTDKIKDYLED